MCSSLYHLLDVIVLFFERRSDFFRSLLTKAKAKWKSPISGRIWDNTLYEWKGWLLERNLDADGRQFFMPIFLQFFLLANALSSFCELQCYQLFYEIFTSGLWNSNGKFWFLMSKIEITFSKSWQHWFCCPNICPIFVGFSFCLGGKCVLCVLSLFFFSEWICT